jgi:hypothetical protein
LNTGNTGSNVEKVERFLKGIRENHSQRSTLQTAVILFENERGDNNNNNNNCKKLDRKTRKLLSCTRKTLDRFTTKDSYTWNNTHNTERTAV